MSIDSSDLITNIFCIDSGIVPISGVDNQHVQSTLQNMHPSNRRITTRKFRKILKKSIRAIARSRAGKCNDMYNTLLSVYLRKAGLGSGARGEHAKKLSVSQRNFRKWVVLSYIDQSRQSDT